jgi:glycine hydroxymethyltransferase
MHVIAAKAICFGEALDPDFARYASQVVDNSRVLAQDLSEAGLRLVSGGTDNHLSLVDLTPLGISGQEAETALEKVGIVANKNAIPYDPKPPRVASGLRLGTPAITSRGFDQEAVRRVARMIIEVLTAMGDEKVQRRIAEEVLDLAPRYPVPGLDL